MKKILQRFQLSTVTNSQIPAFALGIDGFYVLSNRLRVCGK